MKRKLIAFAFFILGIFLAFSVYRSEVTKSNPFKLGLDLNGGSYLVYRADVSRIAENDVEDSMNALRDVIERRINAFGVSEPQVLTEHNSITGEERLIVELPGVTDVKKAVEMIGRTPLLEFRLERSKEEKTKLETEIKNIEKKVQAKKELSEEEKKLLANVKKDPYFLLYKQTKLTGKYLEKSMLQFNNGGVKNGGAIQATPVVGLRFNREGAKIFEDITKNNVGKDLAIYLDGKLISHPTIKSAISGGNAIIEGNFTIQEAKDLVQRLNSGALPIPIELISTNTIGPSLGHDAIQAGIKAGVIGFILVSLILLFWYKIPGLIATLALAIYTVIMLWLFKFIPITLTSAGITGFIISIGIAVDANILIFERMKEEIQNGKSLYDAITIGFKRAWPSIRDANISSIISAIILFWFGTPLIKGFAVTFGLGILISMFTAINVTRSFLLAFTNEKKKELAKWQRILFLPAFSSLKTKNK